MLNRVTQEGVRTGLSGQTETYSYRTFEYDAAGDQTKVVDRNNRTRTFQYDLLNRLTKEVWVDPQNPPAALNTIVSKYDEAGQRKVLTDNSPRTLIPTTSPGESSASRTPAMSVGRLKPATHRQVGPAG